MASMASSYKYKKGYIIGPITLTVRVGQTMWLLTIRIDLSGINHMASMISRR